MKSSRNFCEHRAICSAQVVLCKIDPATRQIVNSLPLLKVGNWLSTQYWTTYSGRRVLASGELVLKGFHLATNADLPGYLRLINPDDLNIDVQQWVYVSSARLMIHKLAVNTTPAVTTPLQLYPKR